MIRSPAWAPQRADWPGLGLALGVGGVSLAAVHALPSSPLLSDVLLALVLGAAVLNTPLRRVFGLAGAGPEAPRHRHAAGLRYVGRWLLRAAIVLMGLKVQGAFFGAQQFALIAGVAAATILSAFFVTHVCASQLGLRRPLADLLAAGTMICGASAVNAVAPVVGARREEQGVAIGATFLFSVVALVSFRPLAVLLGVDTVHAGLWSGLAVNDMSSAIAVGKQMGDLGGTMAAAAKSARVLLLAPTLMAFSILRREGGAGRAAARGLSAHLPFFLLGYLALAVARWAGDELFGPAACWSAVLAADTWAVNLLMASVAAAIGLDLGLAELFALGRRAVLVAAAASCWTAGLSLALILLCARQAFQAAALVGLGAVVAAMAAYRLAAEPVREQERQALDRYIL